MLLFSTPHGHDTPTSLNALGGLFLLDDFLGGQGVLFLGFGMLQARIRVEGFDSLDQLVVGPLLFDFC